MVKKTINVCIDVDVYLKAVSLSATGKKINFSQVCNDALSSIVNTTEEEIKPSDEIEKDIKEKQSEMIMLQAKFNKAKEDEKKEYDLRIERAKAMQKAMRNARVMDF